MNIVDGARALIERHECSNSACRVALHLVSGVWRDSAGAAWCWTGMTRHQPVQVLPPAPVIAPSPLLWGWR